MPDDCVQIQLQDHDGTWRTYITTLNNSQRITSEMKQLKARFPDKRVRAIDASGRLVDLM
jgi:hypothetical protein